MDVINAELNYTSIGKTVDVDLNNYYTKEETDRQIDNAIRGIDVDLTGYATKKYVDSFKGDYRYMQLLKYFILKKNTNTLEENSQFLSYLENLNDVDIDTDNQSNDWTIELK